MNSVSLHIDKQSLKYPKLLSNAYSGLVTPCQLELRLWMLIWFQIYTPIKVNTKCIKQI
jgi:hypothetical protein